MTSDARRTGARVVLGAGLSPGISNLMAARLAKALGRVDRVETAILLSLGDEYGPDSLRHVLDAVAQPFRVFEGGHHRAAVPFDEGVPVDFAEPLGPRTAYLFPWSDVVSYPKTLGAQTSLGRFALDPAWVGRFANVLMRAGALTRLTRPGASQGGRRAVERLKRIYVGRDRFALVVTVEGGGRTMRMRLAGRHQADATADGAAATARALAEGRVAEAGVWLPEQALSHDEFFTELGAMGWTPTTDRLVTGETPRPPLG